MVKITFDDPIDLPEVEEIATPKKSELKPTSSTLTLTEKAAKRIKEIIAKKGDDSLVLRLSVQGGGCSGFSYSFKLTDETSPSDISITNDAVENIRVVIDMMSFTYLKGSEIDFETTLEASQFVVNNPNATSSCGCGSSFSL